MPKMSIGDRGTRITIPPQIPIAGTARLPVPRMLAAKPFITQSNGMPRKMMFE